MRENDHEPENLHMSLLMEGSSHASFPDRQIEKDSRDWFDAIFKRVGNIND
jgi:hypothetical protein